MAIGARKKIIVNDIIPHNPQENLDGLPKNEPVITQHTERKSIVDTQYVPLSHLIVHTSGDLWTVHYYRQLVGLDDPLRPIQIGTIAAEQEYEKIKRFEIRVDTPLDQVQDQQTKEFTVTGEGVVTYGLIPNMGDMFLADIGDGEMGMFTVTSTEKLAYTKSAVYRIRYQLVDSLNEEWEKELDYKTVRTVIFERRLIEFYQSPFITEAGHVSYVSLGKEESRMEELFVERFWSKEVRSIKIPDVDVKMYDKFHAEFCRSIGLGNIRTPIERYSYGQVKIDDVNSIWELFDDMDTYKFPLLHRNFGTVTKHALPGIHVARGVRWSQYNEVIFPKGEFWDIDGEIQITTCEHDFPHLPEKGPVSLPEPLALKHKLTDRVIFKPATIEPYVFSEAFYDEDRENMSVLELMVYRMLSQEEIPVEIVQVICNEIYSESRLNQFYYIPIILMLTNYCRQGGIR